MPKKKSQAKTAPGPGPRRGTVPRAPALRLERLARQMTPVAWRRAVKRLAADLAKEAARAESRVHAECAEVLAWYVTDEQRGEEVHKLYPAVWRHLQTCARCAESYALLAESLAKSESTAATSHTAPQPLPFLQPLPNRPWHQQRSPRLLGGQSRTTFLFNPVHLQDSFSGVPRTGVRGAGPAGTKSLLLSDQIIVNEQPLEVQAWLVRSSTMPDRFHIHLLVGSLEPLKTNLRAVLHWSGQEYTSYFRAGETTFEDISPPEVAREYADIPSPEFQLILEPISDDVKCRD
jgi:hypothetical protein